jgi:hypothetical protein
MTETKRPLKVFLCHAHSDKDAVRDLYSRLTQDGVDAWLDKEKLLPGQDWELEIRKAVREADVVVVCLSKQFNQAGFRQKEVRLALDTAMEKPEGEIFIIPARLEECENLESLKRWHEVDLFEEGGYELLKRALQMRAETISVMFSSTDKTTSQLRRDLYDKQGLRLFYDLIFHSEHDVDDANADIVAKYFLEAFTRNVSSVTIPDKHDETLYVEYTTGGVEYFDPKDGKTIQHALIIQGVITVLSEKGQYRSIISVDKIPDMLFVTITQGVNKSKIRFDSDDLTQEVFNAFVNSIMKDLTGYIPVKPL